MEQTERTQVCVWAQNNKVCVSWSWLHGAARYRQGRPAPWSRRSYNKFAGGNKESCPVHQSRRNRPCWRSEPWLWPDHSEVTAGLRTLVLPADLCWDCVFPALSSNSLGRSLTDACVYNLQSIASPRACNQNTVPCHLQLMCQQCANRTMQTSTGTGERARAGQGAGLRAASTLTCTLGQVP